jgi:hypothetical protein
MVASAARDPGTTYRSISINLFRYPIISLCA